MRTLSRMLPLVPASLLLNGCLYIGDFADSDAYREDFHSMHALDSGGTVTIETFNGSIDLRGWEQNSVEVNGTKSASAKSALDAIKIEVDSTPGSVRIRAVRPPDFYRNMGVRFSIRVPRKARLELISSSNGKIQVEDVEGNARLHTSNGGVRISRIKGEVEARTSNGSIEAEDVDGNVNLHTSNGAIRAETSHGTFEGTTKNGSITARLNDPSTTWPVRAESSNGHIDLTLEAQQLPEVRAMTSNSSILLRLPASASARVRAVTSHSSVTSDFGGLETGNDRRRHSDLRGTIGSGGPLIDLSSTNGSIKILKL
jgi:DUF4097 and DUF4098 domain-containing protein YvlB